MREPFVSLAEYLREEQPVPASAEPSREIEAPRELEFIARPEALAFIAEVKRARAALADALEVVLGDLLRDVASEVVGRELSLAPAQIAAIVSHALARFGSAIPDGVRVHPGDMAALANLAIDVVADETLRRGDAVFAVRSGTIDASLGVRLEEVLRAYGAW